ncbi:hypothetical protein [Rubrivirga sp. IMCC43871]|uniref:hypothetical protein n=1 Tax=Rubrivirga sp. IMCC43871 TaxID=3391575 RepID=UPI00398FDB67
MRILASTLLLALGLTTAASAQHIHRHADDTVASRWMRVTPTHPADQLRTVAAIDRRLATLDYEIAELDRDIAGVRETFRYLNLPDTDRAAYRARARAFDADRRRFQIESGRVQAMYDDLIRYRSGPRARRAYADAVAGLRRQADRLEADAASLWDWNDALAERSGEHQAVASATARHGQMLSQRRSDLRHERAVLGLRRARLIARAQDARRRS